MVCQEKEDHVEMNICNTGSEEAYTAFCSGLEWNQILTLKEKALGSCHMMKPGHPLKNWAWRYFCDLLFPHTHRKQHLPKGK